MPRLGCGLALIVGALACSPVAPAGEQRQPITGGVLDTEHPAVVAILLEGEQWCTGTLIAPNTVLTAAHCVAVPLNLTLSVFVGPSLAGPGSVVDVSDAIVQPGFIPSTLVNDLALLTLRDAPALMPIPLDPRAVDASLVGQSFLAVGYGVTDAAADDGGDRRSGTSLVSEVTDTEFTATPSPSQACLADSGGPALFSVGPDTYVTGVVSRGDELCVERAIYVRIDAVMASFIQPYLAATGPGSAHTGEVCLNNAQCAEGDCIQAVDDPRVYYCTSPCADDCPTGMRCEQDSCVYDVPTPGALGGACSQDDDCADRICHVVEGGGVCTIDCLLDPGVCPAGYDCVASGGLDYVCLIPPKPQGCCSASDGATSPVLLSLVLLVAFGLQRRRRRLAGIVAVLIAAGCSGGAEPAIPFAEVTGDQVPSLAQVIFDPDNGNSGLGVAVGDVNGDGRPDLYLAGGGIYLNLPDPRGFRLEHLPGAAPQDVSLFAAAFGDYDRDGDLDLALSGRGGVQLWENDGTGRFTEVTGFAGVAGDSQDLSLSVAWGDIDGDGWLDLAVANYGATIQETRIAPSRLYLNQRDGTFAALREPLDSLPVRAWVVAFLDVDGDGRLDLYVSDDADIIFSDETIPRRDLVLLNRGLDANGVVQLVESSAAYGLDTPRSSMGLAVGNANRGPGWDLMITDIEATWLFRSAQPGQAFADVTTASGIDMSSPEGESWWQWGCAFSDFDGDGWEDGLVGQSAIFPNQPDAELNAPMLLHNRAGDGFDQIRHSLAPSLSSRAVVLADLDLDGDDDVIVAPYYTSFRFFTNESAGAKFVRVVLEASVSAPGAAGAVVVANTETGRQKRMAVAGGQPHSTSEAALLFGLGTASTADLTITWPSGAVQQVNGLSDGRHVIGEPEWLVVSDSRPPADGTTAVLITVDTSAVGGGAASVVRLAGATWSLDANADGDGIATFELPPRATPQIVWAQLTVDGRLLPLQIALDYE